MMKLKENQEKKVPLRCIEPTTACITKTRCAWSGTVHCRNLSATEPSILPSVITCTEQVKPDKLVASKQQREFL